jgi:hypothetical protein
VAAPQGAERPFDRPHPGPNPYAQYETAAAKLPARDRAAVQTALRSATAAYNAELKQWQADSRAHARAEKDRVKGEQTKSMAELKARAKEEYDYKPRPPERAALVENIDKAVQGAIEKIKNPPPETPADRRVKLEDTIFSTVDDGRLKNLALEVMTSNPLPDANRAVTIISKMTRWDDENPSRRFYKPQGRDILGNVVVSVDGIGYVHLRPEAYKDLTEIARERIATAVAKREKALKPGEPSALQKQRKATVNAVQRSVFGQTLPGDKDYDATVKLGEEADRQKKQIQERNKDNPPPFNRGQAIPTAPPDMRSFFNRSKDKPPPSDGTNKSPFSR